MTNTNDPYSHISAHLSPGPVWTWAQGSMETLISRDNEHQSHLCGRLALMWHTVHSGGGRVWEWLVIGTRPPVFVWTAYQPQHSAIKTSLFLKTTMSNFLWIGFIGFTIWWEVDHSPYQRKYSQYFLPKKRSLKSQQPTFLFIEKIINMNTGRVKMWKTVECCYSWCFDRQLKYKLRVVCTI